MVVFVFCVCVCGLWFVVCGLWFVVCGLWFVVCGLWFVVCGLWFVVCGLWFVVCGLWFVVVVCGLWFVFAYLCAQLADFCTLHFDNPPPEDSVCTGVQDWAWPRSQHTQTHFAEKGVCVSV